MLFNKLARSVVAHYRLIIVAWLVLLVVAVPFAPLAGEAVEYYDMTGTNGLDIASVEADDWIEENFGSDTVSDSVIIVLTSDDALDGETKAVVYEMTSELVRASPAFGGDFDNNVSVQSVYSVAFSYATAYLQQINEAYYATFDELNATRYVLFGIPSDFRELYNETLAVQSMLFGIPGTYAINWMSFNSSDPGSTAEEVDQAAYGMTYSSVLASLQGSDADGERTNITLAYLDSFSSAWNVTTGGPALRLDGALIPGYDAFISSSQFLSISEEKRAFIEAVFATFDMDDHDDVASRNAFCDWIFSSRMIDLQDSLSEELALVAGEHYDNFFTSWSAEIGTVTENEFQAMVTSSALDVTSSLPDGGIAQAMFVSLPWESWRDDALLSELVVDIMSSSTHSERWVISEAAAKGRGASIVTISTLAETIVQNSSLMNFPMPMMQAMLDIFINVPSNDTMLLAVTFTGPDGGPTESVDDIERIRSLLSEVIEEHPSMAVYVTGIDAITRDTEESTNEDVEMIDPFTVILVILLIGLFFRSFVASAVPPAVIGFGLGISFSMVYFLGTYFLSINYTVLTLLLTSMLGAGCDYCIFILSRYKEERRSGADKRQAVETSVTWAGEAISISGLTVIICFGALSLGTLDIMRSMSVLALGIACALLLALTLLPSFLMLLGDRMFWPSRMGKVAKAKESGYFARSARFSIRHAKAILIAALLISIPATYLVVTMETSYDFIESMPETESKDGLLIVSEGFGGGKITPTEIGVKLSGSVFNETGGWDLEKMDLIESLCVALTALDNVNYATSPTRPFGETIDYSSISNDTSIEAALSDQYMRTMVGESNDAILITVIFVAEPYAAESIDSITMIREAAEGMVLENPEIEAIYVGGGTALMYDVSILTQDDFKTILFVVIVGIYLALLVVLGSVINPLRSILTILLSISWTLVVTMVVFEYVFGQTIMWMVPLILLAVCLGLGMDYDLLLTTRVREETRRGRSNEEAIVYAVERTGGIITACGLIMAGAFGTMMLSQGWLLREFGFALMFAILLDAMVVRIYLVPAIMSLLGKWNWWAPGVLAKRYEDVPSEGSDAIIQKDEKDR
ncbi:MAG: MMPL family transporter [Euryarchaeota archaeon]|nr:MMPL family transporter [Euryarchaeota archaeon]